MEHSAAAMTDLPTWVQMAANFGMFAVAVAAGAYGVFASRKDKDGDRGNNDVSLLGVGGLGNAGLFKRFADDQRRAADASESIASHISTFVDHVIEKDRLKDFNDEVERKVNARIAEDERAAAAKKANPKS